MKWEWLSPSPPIPDTENSSNIQYVIATNMTRRRISGTGMAGAWSRQAAYLGNFVNTFA